MKPRGESPPVPAGEQPCELIKVEEVTGLPDKAKGEEGTGTRVCWVWHFATQAIDPETGGRYVGKIFTGDYVTDRTQLGKLLKMMIPGKTVGQLKEVDTDKLIGTWYDINWTIEVKEGGGQKNGYLYVRPYQSPAAAYAPSAPIAVPMPAPMPAAIAQPLAPPVAQFAPPMAAQVPITGSNPFTPPVSAVYAAPAPQGEASAHDPFA